MTHQYTCITCRVGFRDPDIQREHYKTDWHRYNLKRKVADFEPVTAEEFQKRVLSQRQADAEQSQVKIENCKPCNKNFNTKNTYENHLNSKKHKQAEDRYNALELERLQSVEKGEEKTLKSEDKVTADRSSSSDGSEFVIVDSKMVKASDDIETDSEIEEVDSDEWDEDDDEESSLIRPRDCLFCDHHSKSMVKNLTHMTEAHSFFIPDPEYCMDLQGLLLYLGAKISRGFMCIWCNDKGRAFRSQEAAQGHMRDKGHCKAIHEGPALAEYTEFYDYSASYPDHVEGDEEMEVDKDELELPPSLIDDEEFQLVLPSGATIGHRSLLRYYKQNLTCHTGVVVRKTDDKLRRVLRQYRMLGWAPIQTEATVRRARDIQYMRRVQQKWQAQLGWKANKLQTHFRIQSNY